MAPTSALVVVELCSKSRTRSLRETQKSSAPNYQGWCARCLRHSAACGGVAATDGKCAPNSACMAASTLVVGRSLPALHCRKRAGHSANVRRSAMRGGSHCRRRPGLVCAPCVAHHTLARIRLTAKRLRSHVGDADFHFSALFADHRARVAAAAAQRHAVRSPLRRWSVSQQEVQDLPQSEGSVARPVGVGVGECKDRSACAVRCDRGRSARQLALADQRASGRGSGASAVQRAQARDAEGPLVLVCAHVHMRRAVRYRRRRRRRPRRCRRPIR